MFFKSRIAKLRVEPLSILAIIAIFSTAFFVQPDQPSNLIVLLEDPDGKTGAVTVTAGGASQNLTQSGQATGTSAKGDVPLQPFTLADKDIQEIFGETIAARPPLPKSYTLYFQSGQTAPAPQSIPRIAEIAAEAAKRKIVQLAIVGHADSTGSAAVNLRISLQRATAVRDALVAAGLNSQTMTIDSFGDADPAVPAPRGVAEPRNRRVEVTVR